MAHLAPQAICPISPITAEWWDNCTINLSSCLHGASGRDFPQPPGCFQAILRWVLRLQSKIHFNINRSEMSWEGKDTCMCMSSQLVEGTDAIQIVCSAVPLPQGPRY